ncbi:pseudouridine synthase, partial [Candidatus Nomurabacteria bacterium]|nr:pseudouridine synthase [Candidatus Nomurabacteria bacterium]
MLVRLNKAIADKGICSRRKADELIADGKILVNGKVTKELSTKVNPNKDTIEVKTSLTEKIQRHNAP